MTSVLVALDAKMASWKANSRGHMMKKLGDVFRAAFFLTGTVFFILNIWQLAIWFNWLWRMRNMTTGAGPMT